MDTPNLTGSTHSNTSGDESARITVRTAAAIIERELRQPYIDGQLARRLAPAFSMSVKYTGAKATAFTAGQRNPRSPYKLDKIWPTSGRRREDEGDDRDWPSVDHDDELLDGIGAAFQDGHFFAAFGEDVLTDVLLAKRHDVDSEPFSPSVALGPPGDDDEPDDRDWEEAA